MAQSNPFSKYYDHSNTLAGNNLSSHVLEVLSIGTGYKVQFKAFIDSYSDKFTSEWNNEVAFGRMDGMATFKRTGRAISLTIGVPAGSIEESIDNLARISDLINFLYPNYDILGTSANMVSSPLVKMKLANLITDVTANVDTYDALASGLVGYFGGLTYQPDIDYGMFVDGGRLYPKSLKLAFEFTVIHTHQLGFNSSPVGLRTGGYPYKVGNIPQTSPTPPPVITSTTDHSAAVESVSDTDLMSGG
jgi:hypothetical protein